MDVFAKEWKAATADIGGSRSDPSLSRAIDMAEALMTRAASLHTTAEALADHCGGGLPREVKPAVDEASRPAIPHLCEVLQRAVASVDAIESNINRLRGYIGPQ